MKLKNWLSTSERQSNSIHPSAKPNRSRPSIFRLSVVNLLVPAWGIVRGYELIQFKSDAFFRIWRDEIQSCDCPFETFFLSWLSSHPCVKWHQALLRLIHGISQHCKMVYIGTQSVMQVFLEIGKIDLSRMTEKLTVTWIRSTVYCLQCSTWMTWIDLWNI